MRSCLGVLIFALFLAAVPAGAYSFKFDQMEVGSKYTEGEETKNWLSIVSSARTEWLQMELAGKFYLAALEDNYEATVAGEEDSYSKVQTALKFPELSKGLTVTAGDKWNLKNELLFFNLDYRWTLGEQWSFGVRYAQAHRQRLIKDQTGDRYDYGLHQEEVFFKYNPDAWSVGLKLRRTNKYYPKSEDHSYTRLALAQKLKWKVTSKLGLSLDVAASEDDYRVNRDSARERWVIKANLEQNEFWEWTGSCSRSDYYGANGDSQKNGFDLKCKYHPAANWWLAGKIALSDYAYSANYQLTEEETKDPDDDYRSRRQQAVAVEFEQKTKIFTYNIEVFVKQYRYQNYASEDGTVAGGVTTLGWQWAKLDWQLRLAPNGDLITRKAKYELKATYNF
ncbi:MAG TPA: hypothetical protein VIM29_00355 [Bacillota bacterium]